MVTQCRQLSLAHCAALEVLLDGSEVPRVELAIEVRS
jgi:hypothetical protein